MDFSKWGDIAALAVSPTATLVMAFFLWKVTVEMKEVKAALKENGFLKKEDLDDAWKLGNEVHKRLEENDERHDGSITDLFRMARELERDKLSVRDYERERATFVRKPR